MSFNSGAAAYYADLWPRITLFGLRCMFIASQNRLHLLASCSTASSPLNHGVVDRVKDPPTLGSLTRSTTRNTGVDLSRVQDITNFP